MCGAGMATHLSPEEQGIMLELFQALARLDGREIGRQTLRFSGAAQTCPDPPAFLASLQARRRDTLPMLTWWLYSDKFRLCVSSSWCQAC